MGRVQVLVEVLAQVEVQVLAQVQVLVLVLAGLHHQDPPA
jgi:hypothetical protein